MTTDKETVTINLMDVSEIKYENSNGVSTTVTEVHFENANGEKTKVWTTEGAILTFHYHWTPGDEEKTFEAAVSSGETWADVAAKYPEYLAVNPQNGTVIFAFMTELGPASICTYFVARYDDAAVAYLPVQGTDTVTGTETIIARTI